MPSYDYVHELEKILNERIVGNPSYSLRAFARDLGLNASSLSLILNRKQGISEERAHQLSKKLPISAQEQRIFVAAVAKAHSRSKMKRAMASQRLHSLMNVGSWKYQKEENPLLNNWLVPAVYEYLKAFGGESVPQLAAAFLKPKSRIEAVCKKLLESRLIRNEEGCFYAQEGLDRIGGIGPSAAVRRFHKSVIDESKKSIDELPFEERETASSFFTICEKDREAVRDEIVKFRRKLVEKYEVSETNSSTMSVHCLSINFFRLSQWQAKEEKL